MRSTRRSLSMLNVLADVLGRPGAAGRERRLSGIVAAGHT